MALEKQVIGLDLTNGLGNKTDSQLRVPTELVACENLAFDVEGTLRPREGLTEVDTTARVGSALGTVRGLAVLADTQLMVEHGTDSNLSSVHESGLVGHVIQSTGCPRVGVSVRDESQAVAVGSTLYGLDSATVGGLTCTVWDDAGANVIYYSISDASTGVTIVDKTAIGLAVSGANPRVLAINSTTFAILYYRAATIVVRTVSTGSITTISGETALVAGASNAQFDAATDGAGATLVAVIQAGVALFQLFDASWTPGAFYAAGGGADHASPVCSRFGTGHWFIGWWDTSATTITLNAMTSTLGAVASSKTVTGVVSSPDCIVASPSETSDIVVFGWYESVSNGVYTFFKTTADTGATALGSLSLAFGPNTTIASRPWTFNGRTQIAVRSLAAAFDGQSSLFVGEYYASLTAQVAHSASRGSSAPWRVPAANVATVSSVTSVVQFPIAVAGKLTFVNGADQTPTNLQTLTLDYARTTLPLGRPVSVNSMLVYPSGSPTVFDGRERAELGFANYPDSVGASTPAGAGSVANGVYSYTALYEWADAHGVLHRSAPAIPYQFTVAGGPRAVNVSVATLPITKKGITNTVKIAVYRTTSTGTTYYRVGEANNDPLVGSVTFNDTLADASITGNQLLPTTGGVLEPVTPPACRFMCVHQQRIFAGGLENPYEIAYTHEFDSQLAPEFCAELILRVPATHGVLTGLASMDDKLVALTERGVFVFTGFGPDATGGNNGYSSPQLVVSGFGCLQTAPDSVVVSSVGTWFQSASGLRCLGRNMTLLQSRTGAPAGSEVDSLLSTATCVAALEYPGKNQVRFYTSAGCFVLDQTFGQWSLFKAADLYHSSTYIPTHAVVFGGLPVHGTTQAKIWKATGTTDDGGVIATTLTTGWVRIGAVQGFQRVWRVLGLGKLVKASPSGAVQIVLEKDYKSGAGAESSANTAVSTFSNGTTVGSPVQFRHHVKNQKVEAIQITLATGDAEVAWSNLALEIGVKRGAAKLASTRELT